MFAWANGIADGVQDVLEGLLPQLKPMASAILLLGIGLFLMAFLRGTISLPAGELHSPQTTSGKVFIALLGLFIMACSFGVMYGPPGVDVSGTLIVSNPLPSNSKLKLIPTATAVDAALDSGGKFQISYGAQLQPGMYLVELPGPDGPRYAAASLAKKAKVLSLVEPGWGEAYAHPGDAYDHLIELYRRHDQDWRKQFHIVSHLARLARQPDDKKRLLQDLASTSLDHAHFAAALALGSHLLDDCSPVAVDEVTKIAVFRTMRSIWKDGGRNRFLRIRALSTLHCDNDMKHFAASTLQRVVARSSQAPADLMGSNLSEHTQSQRTAAYHLARLGDQSQCVGQVLIDNLGHQDPFVRTLILRGLRKYSGQSLDSDSAWISWWREVRGGYKPCDA